MARLVPLITSNFRPQKFPKPYLSFQFEDTGPFDSHRTYWIAEITPKYVFFVSNLGHLNDRSRHGVLSLESSRSVITLVLEPRKKISEPRVITFIVR